ncbi:MAG: hypothetical protein WC851_02790 [Candidatus Shapirobacteria bacterium]|jgi:hypothetical protein
MSATPNLIEVTILPAQHFIDLGVMYASSPLVRGDCSTSIAQVVIRKEDGGIYSISYRQPLPNEANK